MNDQLEYVRIKGDRDGHLYRVKGYTSDGSVLLVCVSGFFSMYRTLVAMPELLVPVERP